MAGHSKWAQIKRQKAVTDSKRGAAFTRLGNAIAVAAKSGADPTMNFTLRLAVDKAKAANMPAANIQRSIDRGAGKLGGAAIEEIAYEGYGPGGIAVIVECATDNKNRTFPDVRLAFTKNGGRLAEPGSVVFQFSRKGCIRAGFTGDADEATLAAIDAGADDADIEASEIVIYTQAKQLAAVRDKLAAIGFDVHEAELVYVPNTVVEVTQPDTLRKAMNLLTALDDLDDVTNVHTNISTPEPGSD